MDLSTGFRGFVTFLSLCWQWLGDPKNLLPTLAICISATQWFTSRKHNRLTVMPLLTDFFERDATKLSTEFALVNAGLGPAVIESFTVTYLEEPIDVNGLRQILGSKVCEDFTITSLFALPGVAFRKDDFKVIVSVKYSNNSRDITELDKAQFDQVTDTLTYDLRVKVEYRSQYGDKAVYHSPKRIRPSGQ